MSDELRAWYKQRVAKIHDQVSVHSVLRQHGIKLSSHDKEEQISCPFHGKDEKPSARVYLTSSGGPSGAWCFVCRERWDVIALWRKFNDSEQPFGKTLSEIERAYQIPTPPVPEGVDAVKEVSDRRHESWSEFQMQVETRLCSTRDDFLRTDNFKSYAAAGIVLDRIDYAVRHGTLSYEEAKKSLNALLHKIGERVRHGPASQNPDT